MRRRRLLVLPGLVVAGVTRLALAQAGSRVARVAWLSGAAPAPNGRQPVQIVFLDRLRELGWREGSNLLFEARYAGGRAQPLPALAAELVAWRPDLIVTPGTTAARAARAATATVPIVLAGGGDPVGSGLVASLARPGGNVTGVSLMGQEIIPKALSLMHEIVPQARRIDLLANAANPANPFFAKVFTQASRTLGIDGRLLEVRSAEEIEPALLGSPADALVALADPLFYLHLARITAAAIRRRLPLGNTAGREYMVAGCLFSYSVNNAETLRLAASFADRILRGARPAEMPVEQPSRHELLINLKTAKALGLVIPQALLVQADEVLE